MWINWIMLVILCWIGWIITSVFLLYEIKIINKENMVMKKIFKSGIAGKNPEILIDGRNILEDDNG